MLYRIVWKSSEGECYPPDMVWFEPAENLGEGLIAEYEARVAAEEAEDEAAAKEDAELDELEEQEGMPPA